MTYLVDTHIALWWQTGDRRLNRGARAMLDSSSEPPWVSRASLWEVAIKVASGRLAVNPELFADQVEAFGFRWLEIERGHLLRVAAMPANPHHRDPFDRLLVCQAEAESLLLLTADARLAAYGAQVAVV